MNDIALDVLVRVSHGDMMAFKQVYTQASSFVYNVAFQITRNSADAEEVTQDVFMKLYRNLSNFRFRAAFKTWIYRITVNTAINRYRQSQRQEKNRVTEEGIIETVAGGQSAAEGLIQADAKASLDALLNALSPDHKLCVILREIEGLSYQEIAVALNIPINTVRSRLKRARQALLEAAQKEQSKRAM